MSELAIIALPQCESLPRAQMRRLCLNQVVVAALVLISSALLLVSLRLPRWQMRLEAPQYRDQEALHIAVHPSALRGDLKELNVLDQYIGVHVPPTLPQFKWLPGVLTAGAMLGLVCAFLFRSVRAKAL